MLMKGFTGVLPDGQATHYVDRKRWLWPLSVLYPLQPFVAVGLLMRTGNELWAYDLSRSSRAVWRSATRRLT